MNEATQLAEPTEQEIRQMREEIEEAKKEKSRAYTAYSRRYPAICQQTDADPETGCMEFDIEKGRFS